MDNRYSTLQILHEIVKKQSHPTQYMCTPREMVLHSTFDWDLINKHLKLLQEDAMVIMTHTDSPYFSITEKGISFLDQLPAFEQREMAPSLFFKPEEENTSTPL